jgi:selenoprotein W-related protein
METTAAHEKVVIRYCLVGVSYKPRAARAADALKKELGVETELVPGNTGEFTVWVGGRMVAKKRFLFFPKDRDIVRAVARSHKA